MAAPSVELVHLPGLGRAEARAVRNRQRRERRLRWAARAAAGGVLSGAALFAGSTIALNAWDGEDHSGASAPPVVEAHLPPPPPVILAEPLPVTATTLPPYQRWPVHLPGATVDGLLVTDGVRGPRIRPGERGQAVIAVPADPTTAQTFNTGDDPHKRQWWVIERRQWAETDLRGVLAANPHVPTVALVSSLPGPVRPGVVAR